MKGDSQHDATPAACGFAPAPGFVVFLIDESAAMDARVAECTKSKAESVATALNSLLGQLGAAVGLDVALVGHRRDAQGNDDVGCRWGGPLAGRTFVAARDLAAAPLAVEQRLRKVPRPGGVGVAREESVPFPVWYVPVLGDAAPLKAAYQRCGRLLAEWSQAAGVRAKPPLVIGFVSEAPRGDALRSASAALREQTFAGGPPLVFHAHLSSSARIPPTLYPSANGHLPPGAVRTLFECSSVLPEPLAVSLREAQVPVSPGGRGMVYNAKMLDLIRFLSLVKVYARWTPPAVEETKPQAASSTASSTC